MSLEDSWGEALEFPRPRLLGYPPVVYVSQDTAIIVVLGHIVKFGGKIGEPSKTLVLLLRHVVEKTVIMGICRDIRCQD